MGRARGWGEEGFLLLRAGPVDEGGANPMGRCLGLWCWGGMYEKQEVLGLQKAVSWALCDRVEPIAWEWGLWQV